MTIVHHYTNLIKISYSQKFDNNTKMFYKDNHHKILVSISWYRNQYCSCGFNALFFSWICYDNKFNVLPDESDDPKSNCSCLRHIYQNTSDLWGIDLMKSVVQWIRPWQFRFRSCQPESEFSPNDHRYKIGLAAKYLFSFISFGVTHTLTYTWKIATYHPDD